VPKTPPKRKTCHSEPARSGGEESAVSPPAEKLLSRPGFGKGTTSVVPQVVEIVSARFSACGPLSAVDSEFFSSLFSDAAKCNEKRIGFSRWLPRQPLERTGVSTGCGTPEKACPDTNRFPTTQKLSDVFHTSICPSCDEQP